MALTSQILEDFFLKDNLISPIFLQNEGPSNCFFSASSEDISYENISDETLFFEGLSDTHVHHVPPFNVEKISKDDYRLTILMPGVSLENVQSEQKKDKIMISVMPPLNFFNLNAGYEIIHFGIFDVLRPNCPFEFQVNLPEGIEVTKTVLEEGLLKIDLQEKI